MLCNRQEEQPQQGEGSLARAGVSRLWFLANNVTFAKSLLQLHNYAGRLCSSHNTHWKSLATRSNILRPLSRFAGRSRLIAVKASAPCTPCRYLSSPTQFSKSCCLQQPLILTFGSVRATHLTCNVRSRRQASIHKGPELAPRRQRRIWQRRTSWWQQKARERHNE